MNCYLRGRIPLLDIKVEQRDVFVLGPTTENLAYTSEVPHRITDHVRRKAKVARVEHVDHHALKTKPDHDRKQHWNGESHAC